MPLKKYFKGHGKEVMKSIRKAHPRASEKAVKREFYATANKMKTEQKGSTRLDTVGD